MNILTFDIEDWFHILDNESTKTRNSWASKEVRIHRNLDRILNILAETGQTATFFCLGWIAEMYPDLIKKIDSLGYEIGSHTHTHQLVYEQSSYEFQQDVDRSIKTLEDLIGKKIKYFRAPGFSITQNSTWAFEILYNQGIEIDCSVFPAIRSHGGLPTYQEPRPSLINYDGLIIKELPINYISYLNLHIIFSGGGYFRLFPYSLIKRWTKKSNYIMSYMHPRDFDPEQPMINELPRTRKFKSYVGLKSAEKKFRKWLTDFYFIDIKSADKMIDWDHVNVVDVK